MKLFKDEFGNEISEGDLVISAATSSGNLKIGKAYYTKGGSLYIEHVVESGHYWSKKRWNSKLSQYEERTTPLKTAAGTNVLLLRRADGTLTETMQMLMNADSPSQ